MPRQIDEIDVCVRARYPLLYVVTWEEGRVQEDLLQLAKKGQKKIFFWSLTRGMCNEANVCDAAIRDPQACLDYVLRCNFPALFVLKDFHPYMQDPGVIRRLRDLVAVLPNSYKTVIVLSPVLTIPVELEKDVTVIDYSLPGAEDIGKLLDGVIESLKGNAGVRVNLTPSGREKFIQAAQGMTLTEAENVFAKCIVLDGKLEDDDVDVVIRETKQVIRKSRMLEFYEAREDLSQVGGLELLKDWLKLRGPAFGEKARSFGLPQPKGVMILGVQGCGKSLSCKCISALWKMPLLRLDMGAVFQGIVGSSEENMRRAIKTAESVAPCVLWLDEIEKGLAGTQSSSFSDAGTTARVFSTFLTWMQEKAEPVFVAATANNIRMLPPELLRKGRFDEIFFVDLPSAAERRAIFEIHVRKVRRDPARLDLDRLSALAEGFSGAEIEQAVVSALFVAFNRGRDLEAGDLEAALSETVPLSRTMREEIEGLRAWAASRARPASSAPPRGEGARRLEVPRAPVSGQPAARREP